MPTLKFYYAPFSSSDITEAVLSELEAAMGLGKTLAERVAVTLHEGTREAAYLAINPNGQVPALVVKTEDGGGAGVEASQTTTTTMLWESAAITMYLGEVYGVSAGLYPGPERMAERGEAMKWIVWCNVNLPVHARAILAKTEGDDDGGDGGGELRQEKEKDRARTALGKLLDVLEGAFGDGREYLLGERYSLADTHVWSFCRFIVALEGGVGVEMGRRGGTVAWMERVGAREALKGV